MLLTWFPPLFHPPVINININPAESPFAQLKRKALMRKLENQKMRLGALLGGEGRLFKGFLLKRYYLQICWIGSNTALKIIYYYFETHFFPERSLD